MSSPCTAAVPAPDPFPMSARGFAAAVLVVAAAWAGPHIADPRTSPADLLPWLALVAGGLTAGLLAGLLGIGGALVTIPLFQLVLPLLGVPASELPAAVIGCALLTMVPTTIAATLRQARHGAVDAGWLRRLAIPVLAGSATGAALAATIGGPVLVWAFAAHSLYYGLRLLLDRHDDGVAARPGPAAGASRLPVPVWAGAVGMFLGAVGMGAGSLLTPLLRHRGLSLRTAVATAGASSLCVALGGSGTFVMALLTGTGGHGIHVGAALAVGVAAVVAAPAGVSLSHRLPTGGFRGAVGAINVVGALSVAAQLAGWR